MLYAFLNPLSHHRQAAYLKAMLIHECPVTPKHGGAPVDLNRAENRAKDLMRTETEASAFDMINLADGLCRYQLGNNIEHIMSLYKRPGIVKSVHLGQRRSAMERLNDYFVYFLTTDCRKEPPAVPIDIQVAISQYLAGTIDQNRAAEIVAGSYEEQCDRPPPPFPAHRSVPSQRPRKTIPGA